jgi:hypothetical protein
LNNQNYTDYQKIVKYIFGYESYENVKLILYKIQFSNPYVYKLILDNQLLANVKEKLTDKIEGLRGYINE